MQESLAYDLLANICKPYRPWPAWILSRTLDHERADDNYSHDGLHQKASLP